MTSGSAGGILSGVVGGELVINRKSQEVDFFTYSGQGTGVIAEADIAVYTGLAWNLEVNKDYSGLFSTLTFDVALYYGVQVSVFWIPGTIPFTGNTWGFSVGPSRGVGFGVTGTETDFVCQSNC